MTPCLTWLISLLRRMRSSLPRRFWEGAYPALLKVYFEHISVVGIVNRYTDHGPVGMCRASKLHYVTTRGGFATDEQDLGWQNVKGLAKVYGIEHADCISVNATDVLRPMLTQRWLPRSLVFPS